MQGDVNRACSLLKWSLDVLSGAQAPLFKLEAHCLLAHCSEAIEDLAQAEVSWCAALDLASKQHCTVLHRSALQWKAVTMLRMGMLLEQNPARLKDAAAAFAMSLDIATAAFGSDLDTSVQAQVRSVSKHMLCLSLQLCNELHDMRCKRQQGYMIHREVQLWRMRTVTCSSTTGCAGFVAHCYRNSAAVLCIAAETYSR
jgi:hypothetical protein